MSKFISGRFDGTRGSHDDGFPEAYGFTAKLHSGRQGKHIPGHKNYIPGKSVLRLSLDEAQRLVEEYAGTGERKSDNREVVDFHRVIGTWVNLLDGKRYETTRGVIHYSKTGCHIVPTRPGKKEC